MKYLYACYGRAGLDCLYHLLNQRECGCEDIFAITYSDTSNRELVAHLEALGIPYTTESIKNKEVVEQVREFSPDYLFSIHFRDIIRREILDAVRFASVNLHPSLLPDYKGCFSAPWVLINGEDKSGITYHMIDEGVDTGDIILQKELNIGKSDTAFSLFNRLIALGAENFPEMFNLVVREQYAGAPQASGGRIYRREVPYEGYLYLEWGRERIHNFIRGMYFPPYPGAKLNYEDEEIEFKSVAEFEDFCIAKGIDLK